MKTATLILATLLASNAFAQAPKAQSKKDRFAQAQQVVWLLDQSNAKAIECKTKSKQTISIAKGQNPEDGTGLVITGDFSYGTDEIKNITAGENLVIEWGEEGNYHLLIPNFAYSLFNFQPGSSPKVTSDSSAFAVLVVEQESSSDLTCKVK